MSKLLSFSVFNSCIIYFVTYLDQCKMKGEWYCATEYSIGTVLHQVTTALNLGYQPFLVLFPMKVDSRE